VPVAKARERGELVREVEVRAREEKQGLGAVVERVVWLVAAERMVVWAVFDAKERFATRLPRSALAGCLNRGNFLAGRRTTTRVSAVASSPNVTARKIVRRAASATSSWARISISVATIGLACSEHHARLMRIAASHIRPAKISRTPRSPGASVMFRRYWGFSRGPAIDRKMRPFGRWGTTLGDVMIGES
jgi:hypothetical protein